MKQYGSKQYEPPSSLIRTRIVYNRLHVPKSICIIEKQMTEVMTGEKKELIISLV